MPLCCYMHTRNTRTRESRKVVLCPLPGAAKHVTEAGLAGRQGSHGVLAAVGQLVVEASNLQERTTAAKTILWILGLFGSKDGAPAARPAQNRPGKPEIVQPKTDQASRKKDTF